MGFGMGCCCLQLTFQACNVADARRLYDGLIPIGPILVCSIRALLYLVTERNSASLDGCEPRLAGLSCGC